MIHDLSKRVTSESDLQNLATNGLKVPKYIIDEVLHDKRHTINEAALQVLKEWKKNNADPFQAYDALCDALTEVFMARLIYEVLKN